ncbi:probable RNA polymerase II nuclear localization protein SLC7A6OS [Venturia canescens]|uniref:probable RNA polymerase II nuclear localization protein SLC7A6OS n=1 Tax=Venturia canescens TaxID=32260 RepID=UPI001C9D60DA|nr:probable RNA polymerase II nuclear localization protein SLC7A6OS [Venturia canescens]
MSTVVRVKRRFDHEPLDALVIAVKKRKLETGEATKVISEEPLTEVLKFAGTVENPEDNVVEHLKKTLTKEELKANYKQRTIDLASKARAKAKEESREHRYKVINYFRSADAASSQDQNDGVMTVIDVEHSKLDDAEKTPVLDETEIGYVYDLYYTQAKETFDLDDDMTIQPFEQDLVFDCEDTYNVRREMDDESEDSNSESNFRNDYPDSEKSENSIGEEDMRAAIRNIKIGDESSDLSSEDDFVYAADQADVEAYGYKYAKYKARVKEELDQSDSDKSDYVYARSSCDEDEDDDEHKHEDEEN